MGGMSCPSARRATDQSPEAQPCSTGSTNYHSRRRVSRHYALGRELEAQKLEDVEEYLRGVTVVALLHARALRNNDTSGTHFRIIQSEAVRVGVRPLENSPASAPVKWVTSHVLRFT